MANRKRLSRTERIYRIDQEIRVGNYPSASILAEMFNVKERTIYNDYKFMIEQLDAPIKFDKLARGWYYADESYTLPPIRVRKEELLALALSQHSTPFDMQFRSTLNKIARYLPDEVQINLKDLEEHYTVATRATIKVDPQLLLELEQAIHKHRQITILYHSISRDECNERTVKPYHLYKTLNAWYLIGYDLWRQDICTFHLERIEKWNVSTQHFKPDPDFSVKQYLSQKFLRESGQVFNIAIRFDAHQARWIRERVWHETQTLENLSDGGVILRFRAGGMNEIKRWIMQYGAQAEVLEPPELREAVVKEVVGMARLYPETQKSLLLDS